MISNELEWLLRGDVSGVLATVPELDPYKVPAVSGWFCCATCNATLLRRWVATPDC